MLETVGWQFLTFEAKCDLEERGAMLEVVFPIAMLYRLHMPTMLMLLQSALSRKYNIFYTVCLF